MARKRDAKVSSHRIYVNIRNSYPCQRVIELLFSVDRLRQAKLMAVIITRHEDTVPANQTPEGGVDVHVTV